jgi:hypothetical protein
MYSKFSAPRDLFISQFRNHLANPLYQAQHSTLVFAYQFKNKVRNAIFLILARTTLVGTRVVRFGPLSRILPKSKRWLIRSLLVRVVGTSSFASGSKPTGLNGNGLECVETASIKD